MQIPLWNIKSGKFAGWNIDNSVYDSTGKNIGPVINKYIYSVDGTCVGEIHNDRFVGKRLSMSYPKCGKCAPYGSIGIEHRADIKGLDIEGWKDPDF